MCVISRNLVCASSKTYVLKIKEDCADKIAEFLRKNGKVTAEYGPLLKGVYKDAIVTLVKPDKLQVILQFAKISIEELENELRGLA